jgi:hypothetical protein
LVLGALIVAAIAAGPHLGTLFGRFGALDLYGTLSSVFPGLDAVRLPWRVVRGVHLVASLLAGLGCAALLRLWRWQTLILPAAALICLAYVDMMRPAALGMQQVFSYGVVSLKPRSGEVEFFEELEKRGNQGPILEWPLLGGKHRAYWLLTGPQVFLAAYHHRPTSGCLSSFPPHEAEMVASIALKVPAPEAIRELHDLGFTTIIVHHHGGRWWKRRFLPRFMAEVRRPRGTLRLVFEDAKRAAYAIEVGKRQGRPPVEAPQAHEPVQRGRRRDYSAP